MTYLYNYRSIGIAPTFLNWFRGRRMWVKFLLDKERKFVRKKLSFIHTKRYKTLFRKWVQSRVGAIPRLPQSMPLLRMKIPLFSPLS